MKNLRCGGAVASFAVAGCWLAACSTGMPQGSGQERSGESVTSLPGNAAGSVGLHLNIPEGFTIGSLNWSLTNGSNSYSGTVMLTDDAGHSAQSIEFVVGPVVAGSGYAITLTGSDSNGDPCSGTSATFAVTAGMSVTAQATVVVTCNVPTDASISAPVDSGSVAIDAGVIITNQAPFICPGISGVAISPAELLPPETAALSVASTMGGGGTGTLQWTATCGSGTPVVTNPTSANATFSCGSAVGTTCTVTATVGLIGTGADGGSVGPVCTGVANTSISETIACEAQCTTASMCPASTTACGVPSCTGGRCGFTPVAAGTSCADSGGTLCDGAGACVPAFDVLRVGNGSSALGATTAVPVFIDQYTLAGALLNSIPIASTGAQALTLVGDISEGDLTTSVDGRFLVFAGHNYASGTMLTGTSSTNAIAEFVAAGVTPAVTATLLPNAFSTGGAVRSAVSLDGSEVWVAGTGAGTTGGLWYASPSVLQIVGTTSAKQGRVLRIAGSPNQLYGDSNANPPGIFSVGSGTPTIATSLTELPGLSTTAAASPYGMVFVTVGGVPTLYVADDGTTAGTGGLGKFTFAGGAWTLVWKQMGVGPVGADGGPTGSGYRGLAGYVTGSTVTLMASTGMGALAQNSLVVIVDTGLSTGPSSQSVVVPSSSANELFRGVALPPHL